MAHTAQSGASPNGIPDLSAVDDIPTNLPPKSPKLFGSLSKADVIKPANPVKTAFVAWMARQAGARNEYSVRRSDEDYLQLYLEALASLLRGNGRKSTPYIVDVTTDLGPPRVVECIVARGALFATAAELLRNDSIDYISSLASVYNALLDLVCVMLGSQSTSSLILCDRTVYTLEEQLLKFSFSALQAPNVSSTTSSRGEGQQLDKSASISKCLTAVAGQCRAYLRLAAQLSSDYTDSPDGQRKARICQRVIDMTVSVASHGGKSRLSDAESAVAGKPDERPRSLDCPRVLELPDEVMLSQFRFQQDAVKLNTAALARMKALVGQVVDLRTCLPDHGIWVRHGTSRCDVMKVLIMGPEGTPYQYGLYEFDLFCPAQFPKVPPKMHFCTTGRGRARFNPNLYESGKVCLSLLGTWGNPTTNKMKGVAWDEKVSTLWQVLLSIQAMVFVEKPYYNEPGLEAYTDPKACQEYDARVMQLAVQHAMLDWHGRRDDAIWGSLVRQHFRTNGSAIMKTAMKWKRQLERQKRRDVGRTDAKWETLEANLYAALASYGPINKAELAAQLDHERCGDEKTDGMQSANKGG